LLRTEFPDHVIIRQLKVGGSTLGIVFAVGSVITLLFSIPGLWIVTVAAVVAASIATILSRYLWIEPNEPLSITSTSTDDIDAREAEHPT
jgi:hypothetical protein